MARLELEQGTDVLLLETGDALLLEGGLVSRLGDGGANFHHGRRVRTHSEKLITGNFDTYSSWTFE